MKYKVLSNLKTGEGTFKAGDEIEMDKETAKGLVDIGVLAEMEQPKVEAPIEIPVETPKKRGRPKK